MKFIKPKVEYLPQSEGIDGIYKQIERCARTCYKSEDKITEDSAKSFVERMIKSGHTAMLEKGTVYLKFTMDYETMKIVNKYIRNPYSYHVTDYKFYYVTTNFRVLVENEWLDDLKYACKPTELHEKRYTFKFTTDIGIARELTRHRVFSFAQESTRYCNYSRSKFKGVGFIIPSWLEMNELELTDKSDLEGWFTVNDSSIKQTMFMESCWRSEEAYLNLIKNGATAEQARQVLPLSTKTELCMTGFESDWHHVFDLRYKGTTGKPHPDMKYLMGLLVDELNKNNIEIYE